jgi:hypothetical protein
MLRREKRNGAQAREEQRPGRRETREIAGGTEESFREHCG